MRENIKRLWEPLHWLQWINSLSPTFCRSVFNLLQLHRAKYTSAEYKGHNSTQHRSCVFNTEIPWLLRCFPLPCKWSWCSPDQCRYKRTRCVLPVHFRLCQQPREQLIFWDPVKHKLLVEQSGLTQKGILICSFTLNLQTFLTCLYLIFSSTL